MDSRCVQICVCITLFHLATAFGGPASSSREAKLIGSWTFASVDSTLTVTYRKDHTFSESTWTGGERFVGCTGKWHLEGNDIVREVTWSIYETLKIIDADAKRPPSQIMETIDHLSSNTLAIKNGVTYTREKRAPKTTL